MSHLTIQPGYRGLQLGHDLHAFSPHPLIEVRGFRRWIHLHRFLTLKGIVIRDNETLSSRTNDFVTLSKRSRQGLPPYVTLLRDPILGMPIFSRKNARVRNKKKLSRILLESRAKLISKAPDLNRDPYSLKM